ncbi:MAG: HPr-rel-A system PqqD family peptide chaperone [Massilia sp.]|nr:HPr-rel-A system PqqD family peptide chaperone [Massilia sp.]
MPLPTSWRLAPGQHLLHRCWDGECVLYNDLTGDTHLVDEFALELLEMLRAAPMAHPLPEDPLAAVLADLAALHLIEAAC